MTAFVSVCVCLSVCLSDGISLEPHARDLYQIFVHVAYGRGWVLVDGSLFWMDHMGSLLLLW